MTVRELNKCMSVRGHGAAARLQPSPCLNKCQSVAAAIRQLLKLQLSRAEGGENKAAFV